MAGRPVRGRFEPPLEIWPKARRELWAQWDVSERLAFLSKRSLDECLSIIEAPLDTRDAVLMNAKVQVIRAVLMVCTKIGIESSRREGERERVLGEMAADLRAEQAALNGTEHRE